MNGSASMAEIGDGSRIEVRTEYVIRDGVTLHETWELATVRCLPGDVATVHLDGDRTLPLAKATWRRGTGQPVHVGEAPTAPGADELAAAIGAARAAMPEQGIELDQGDTGKA